LISINAIRARRGEPAALIRSGKVFAMTRLLIAVDGSAHSDNATRLAIDLARRCGPAEIFVITVMPMLSGEVMTFVPKEMIDRYYQEEGAKALASARKLLDDAGLSYRHHIGVGPIGPTIVAYANEQRCDQIILGSRGHGAVVGLVLGSVATRVIAEARQPVTVVK
jgi:nucleotide-binding universal stress UspA family protein